MKIYYLRSMAGSNKLKSRTFSDITFFKQIIGTQLYRNGTASCIVPQIFQLRSNWSSIEPISSESKTVRSRCGWVNLRLILSDTLTFCSSVEI